MISGMEPEEIIKRTENNLKSLRDIGLTGFFTTGSIYTKGTALFMALHTDDPPDILSKMQQIMAGNKIIHGSLETTTSFTDCCTLCKTVIQESKFN